MEHRTDQHPVRALIGVRDAVTENRSRHFMTIDRMNIVNTVSEVSRLSSILSICENATEFKLTRKAGADERSTLKNQIHGKSRFLSKKRIQGSPTNTLSIFIYSGDFDLTGNRT